MERQKLMRITERSDRMYLQENDRKQIRKNFVLFTNPLVMYVAQQTYSQDHTQCMIDPGKPCFRVRQSLLLQPHCKLRQHHAPFTWDMDHILIIEKGLPVDHTSGVWGLPANWRRGRSSCMSVSLPLGLPNVRCVTSVSFSSPESGHDSLLKTQGVLL